MLFQTLVVVMTRVRYASRVQTGGIHDQLPISPRLATRVIYSSVRSVTYPVELHAYIVLSVGEGIILEQDIQLPRVLKTDAFSVQPDCSQLGQ